VKLLAECYACAMRQTLAAARLVTDDHSFHHRCLREAALILARAREDMTPPEVGEEFYRMVRELSGEDDPFREQKLRQNEVVTALLPWLRDTVAVAPDPLLMAVRLSIAGNAVDPGAQESFDLERSVRDAVGGEAGLGAYPALREGLARAKRVLFIADNCGEVVFDRVLIETILARLDVEVTLAVRGAPIINDVTELEAREVGMDRLCEIVSSGMEMPGTLLARTTGHFREAFEGADLVISKGQGNWETLEEAEREIFFLFQAKCSAVAAVNGCAVGQSLLVLSGGGVGQSM
jgi:uncharacterized protein with ATP-grasp and redox domains